MPLRKKASKINLAETFTYVTRDTSPTSDRYFGIVKFPDRLTAGKNLFKLRINNTNFVENSQIHIEILDFNGEPIYWEPLYYIEKDGTRVIAIYIYPETAPGNATIYVAGRLREGGGTGLPFSRDFNSPQHADIPNILWSRTVPVAPFASNDSEIIFTTQPKLTISEVVQPYLQPTNLTNVFTRVSASANATLTIVPQPSTTTQTPAVPASPEGALSAGTPNFGKQFFDISTIQTALQQSNNSQMDSPPLNTLSGFSKLTTTNFPLSKSMEGGVLVINDPIISVPPLTGRNSANKVIPGSQTSTQWNNNTVNAVSNQTLSGSYKFAITQVINSTTARVAQFAGFANDDDNTNGPWAVQIRKGPVTTLNSPTGIVRVQPATQTINRIESATSFTASFTKPTQVIYTQNSSSFADIILANTEPATGDVYRIKTLYKPSGFFGDFIDLGDTILERQNILIDSSSLETNIAVGSAYEQFGNFESLQEINTYWSASSVGNLAANPMTLAYNEDILIGSADLRTNWSGINQYTASIGAASIFQIKKLYRPIIYKDTTYIVNFQVGLPNDIKLYNSLDPNILNNRLDVYISGSSVTPETETLNVSIGDVFVERNIPATLTGVFADGKQLGTRIGSVRCKSIPKATATVTLQFKALKTGPMDIKFVTRRGTWLVGEIEVLADKQTGFSPNYVRVFKRIPTEHLKTPLTFKFQYYDFRGNKADLETIAYGAIFKGGNVYIDGNNNLMTGSTYIGNTVGSGIEMAGVSSGYLRSVGYKGFTSASLGKGPGGFLMWSGSNNLTVGVDTYLGVGLELIAGSGSYFRYRTNPSEIIVQTDKFFFGSQNQYISGANGNIEISSSNFHLQTDGDVVMSGTITANAGQIGGWSIGSTYLSSSNLILDSNGSLRTANYIPDFQGWAISSADNGSAEFQNVKIRGTLSTAVFEKQSVNAVGGQLYIANSTVLTGSSQYPNGNHPASATTMSVENVTGFVAGEILSAKKVTSTGFKTEYIRVMSASRFFPASETNLSGQLFVQRAYGSGVSGPSASLGGTPSTAQSYSGSQVLVSTGRIGTGYIRINANPQDDSTPFIDIVERTGSGIYAVDLKARLGDLSGLSGTSKVLGRTNPGFGLATDNVYLQGGINARFGNIGGFAITQHAITGSGFFLSGSAPNSGVNLRRNMFISSSRFNVKGNGDITASNALFSGTVTAVNFTVKHVDVVNANSGSYLRSVSGGKKLVFNGALGGARTYSMAINVTTGFVIKGIELSNTGSSVNSAVDVYIQTKGMTFDDAIINSRTAATFLASS